MGAAPVVLYVKWLNQYSLIVGDLTAADIHQSAG